MMNSAIAPAPFSATVTLIPWPETATVGSAGLPRNQPHEVSGPADGIRSIGPRYVRRQRFLISQRCLRRSVSAAPNVQQADTTILAVLNEGDRWISNMAKARRPTRQQGWGTK